MSYKERIADQYEQLGCPQCGSKDYNKGWNSKNEKWNYRCYDCGHTWSKVKELVDLFWI